MALEFGPDFLYDLCDFAAIEEANSLAGPDTISFYDRMTIQVDPAVGALPPFTEQLKIDASSQWDATLGRPGVILDGGDGSMGGLDLRADHCTIYGLGLRNFTNGVTIFSNLNAVGGVGAGQRNVIGGNSGVGVLMLSGAHDNVVQNNWIGLNPAGTGTDANDTGVLIWTGAYNNTIGSLAGGGGNVISGNTGKGIELTDGGNAGLAAPVITSASIGGAAGTGCAGCAVQIFCDSADEGEFYDADATVNASGHWSYVGLLTGPNVTAVVTDGNGNTSEFSAPRAVAIKLYMPVARK